jgi:hypothetical protein
MVLSILSRVVINSFSSPIKSSIRSVGISLGGGGGVVAVSNSLIQLTGTQCVYEGCHAYMSGFFAINAFESSRPKGPVTSPLSEKKPFFHNNYYSL